MTAALQCSGLMKRFGGVVATDELALTVSQGEIHALIGPNGAGKSTAIALLAGELRPDAGRVLLHGANVTGLSVAARVRRRSDPVVPDYVGAAGVHRAAEPGVGDTGAERSQFPLLARCIARSAAGAGGRAAAAGGSGWRSARISARRTCRTASSVSWSLGWRWRANHPCCCWTSRWLALVRLKSTAMVALIAGLRGRISVLLVEHDMDAVFALADRIQRAGCRARDRDRQPGGDSLGSRCSRCVSG